MLTRWTYLVFAAAAAVLAILSIFQLIIAFADYRMIDFEAGTANNDMKNLKDALFPTCIEGITDKTVKDKKGNWDRRTKDYDKDCLETTDKHWRDSKEGLATAIQNTAHLFFRALHANPPLFKGADKDGWIEDAFYNSAQAAVGSILAAGVENNYAGCTGARYNCREETFKASDSLVRPLNHSDAYQALLELAHVTTGGSAFPVTTCTEIYKDHHPSGEAGLTFNVDYERRVSRAAQKLDDFNLPIDQIGSKCDSEEKSTYTTADAWWDPVANAFSQTVMTESNINLLYTHCVIQHSYKSSGQGVLSQPEVGLTADDAIPDPIQAYKFYQDVKNKENAVDKYKEPIPHTSYARIYLGRRYGDTVFTYTVLILSGGFLCGIALMTLLVEATRRERYEEAMNETVEGTLRDWMWFKRIQDRYFYLAWTLSLIGLVFGFLLWLIKIIVLYGGSQGYTRPICHSEADNTVDPYKDIALRFLVDDKNRGGWRNDVDAHQYEILCLILQASALLALWLGRQAHHKGSWVSQLLLILTCCQDPDAVGCVADLAIGIIGLPLRDWGDKQLGIDSKGTNSDVVGEDRAASERRLLAAKTFKTAKKVDKTKTVENEWIWSCCLFGSRFAFVAFVFIGAVLVFGGQAFASYWFGVTWARAVLDVDYAANEHMVYHHLVSQTVVLFGTTGALGALVASIICAFMIRGSGGWCSPIVTATRVAWLLYIGLFFVVMLEYWNRQYDAMDPEKSKDDCEAVYATSESTSDNDKVLIDDVDVCQVRYYTYIVGVVVLAISLLIPLSWKLFRCTQSRSTGNVATNQDGVGEDAGAVGTDGQSQTQTGERGGVPAEGGQGGDEGGEVPVTSSGSGQSAPFRFPGNRLPPNVPVRGYAQHVNGLDNFLRSPQGQAMRTIDIRHVSRR